MMMPIQNNASVASPSAKPVYALNPFSEWVTKRYESFKTIPARGSNLVDTFHADARQAKNPVVSAAKQLAGNVISAATADVEFKRFDKTPELFGINLPRLPLTLTLAMFFGSMVPARVHSEYLRAPDVDDDGDGKPDRKDYRAIGDVIVRDGVSISLFLLAFDPVKDAMLRKKQRDGAIFSAGNTHNPRMMIASSGFSPRQLSHPVAYDKLDDLYNFDSPAAESFAHLIAMDNANDALHQTIQARMKRIGLWNKQYASTTDSTTLQGREAAFLQQAQHQFKAAGNRLATDVQGVSTEKLKLKARLNQGFQATSFNMNGTLGSSADNMVKRLFELDALRHHTGVESATHTGVIQELRHQQATLKANLLNNSFHPDATKPHAYQQHIVTLPEHVAFTNAMNAALQHGSLENYNFLCDKAKNANRHIDTLTKTVMATAPTSVEGKPLTYQQVFSEIKNSQFAHLEENLARYRAGENLLASLSHPTHGPESLQRVKAMFENSKQAMHAFKHLDSTVKEIQTSKGAEFLNAGVTLSGKRHALPIFDAISNKLQLGTFKRFNPTSMLVDAGKAMRAPSDFTSFMFVAGVIGFFPVWLIQALTETEYRLRKGHDHRKLEESKSSDSTMQSVVK